MISSFLVQICNVLKLITGVCFFIILIVQELNAIYQKGERSVEASANLVGLQLPPKPAPWDGGK